MSLPETIGEYEVLALLGRGGMSEVFRVRKGAQELALKRLLGTQSDGKPTAAERKRLAREIKALEKLDHPNVVGLRDQGEADGYPFAVFELVEGETLDALVRGGAPQERSLRALQHVAQALEHAHAAGVVHRDVKPSNIVVRGGEVGVLVDFGLARADDSSALTQDGDILGTPAFMPPEQADGRAVEADARSDVYGLGATLYFVLTGRPPFAGQRAWQIARAVVCDPPPPPRELNPEISPELEQLALDTLAKDPGLRPASAAAFGERLRTAIAPATPTAPVATANEQTSSWAVIAAGAVALVLILALHLSRHPLGPAEPTTSEAEVAQDDDGPVWAYESEPDPSPPTTRSEAAQTGPVGAEPPKPVKTAARVFCHQCKQKAAEADHNFCPACQVAYLCGSCGEPRDAETRGRCGYCEAVFK